jgi:hypothetical protein
MQYRLFKFHRFFLWFRHLFSEEVLALFLVLFVFVLPASADTRLQDRGLYMQSSLPSVVTNYTISFQYISPEAVGSVDMLICQDPIPYDPCVPPAGLDVSHAVLTNQTGETGFSILSKTTNHLILTRQPEGITSGSSSYTFSNVVNPSDTSQSFAIRLQTHSSTDATGPEIDFGSIEGQVTNAIELETQVPPMLIFCMAQQVAQNCAGTNDTYYTDLGTLDSETTLTAQSEMAVGTNASQGFVITANGTTLSAGTNVINALSKPTPSEVGTNQFGINLVQNSDPVVGANQEGDWPNAMPTSDYNQANKYKFVSGDVIASSPDVSLMEKFTVSYVINSSVDLRAGVYTTTITYIASGRF